jgi:hypothetical protein
VFGAASDIVCSVINLLAMADRGARDQS